MQRELGTSIELVQAVVPIFLMAQAIGQMAFGPVSDRFGRRPVIVGGLGLYLAGTVIALLAQSIGAVHVGRAAQGFGSACGIAVGRAVLRDISHGPALAQAMALAMAIFALGPISAPLVGYGLVALGGWRAIFLGMALFASCLLAFALLRFKETNEKPDPDALRPGRLLHSLGRIATQPAVALLPAGGGGDAVRHHLVRLQRAPLLQVGVRHRGAAVRAAVRGDGARHHTGADRQQPGDRGAGRAGDDARGGAACCWR